MFPLEAAGFGTPGPCQFYDVSECQDTLLAKLAFPETKLAFIYEDMATRTATDIERRRALHLILLE